MQKFVVVGMVLVFSLCQLAKGDDNKETDKIFGYSVEKEKLEIAIALSQATAVWLLGAGKGKPAVSTANLIALKDAQRDFHEAQKLVSDIRKTELVAENASKIATLSEEIKTLGNDAAAKSKELAAAAKKMELFNAEKTALSKLNTVSKALRAEKIQAASAAFTKATSKVIENGSAARATSLAGKGWKTVKVLGRTYLLADLGIKGYAWVVLETDPGLSPAAGVVYHGTRKLYNKAVDAVSNSKPTHK